MDLFRHKTQHCPQCLSGSIVDLLRHKTQQCPNVFPAVSWICFAINPSSGIPSNQSGSWVFESKLTTLTSISHSVFCAVLWLYLRCIKAFYHILIYAQIFHRWCLILHLNPPPPFLWYPDDCWSWTNEFIMQYDVKNFHTFLLSQF